MLPNLSANEQQLALPLSFRMVAGYMLAAGIVSLVWPLLNLGPKNPEFEAQSLAFKMGDYTRALTFAVAYIIAGIGLFLHHAWARKLALNFLASRNCLRWKSLCTWV